MKILISHYAIIDKEGFGRSFMLAKELAYLGNDVHFLTTLPSNRFYFPYKKEVRERVNIIAFPDIVPNFMRRTGFGFLSFILKTIYIFAKNFDIYHSDAGHRPNGGIAILLKKVFYNIIYICEWWDHFGKGGQYDSKKSLKKYTHGLYDLVFEIFEKKKADGVVCLSSEMMRRGEKAGIREDNMIVINGGADVRSIIFNEKSIHREQFGIKPNSLVFGFVGMNEGELNDILLFIDSLNELSVENKKFSNCVLLTTGGYVPKSFGEKLNLKFIVREMGWVDYNKFSDILNCVDLFVLLQQPNLLNKTRWPNKLGDYIAAGRKTLINPVGDTEFLIKKYKKLFIDVSYNKKSIKLELVKAFDNGSIYNDREEIRQIAEKELSWEQKGIQLFDFYNKIIKSRIGNK